MKYTHLKTSLCEIVLAGDSKGLSNIFLKAECVKIPADWQRDDAFFTDIVMQLKEYLSGKRTEFQVKLNPQGTDFQKKAWNELKKIPYGKLCSYKDIAIAAGNPKACRAVGMANNKNPIPLIIPCHRVIGANGKLVGFGSGLDIKEKLINLEQKK
jgi:methylated-DNA-[protein]-cysteine S-methyltransferase